MLTTMLLLPVLRVVECDDRMCIARLEMRRGWCIATVPMSRIGIEIQKRVTIDTVVIDLSVYVRKKELLEWLVD